MRGTPCRIPMHNCSVFETIRGAYTFRELATVCRVCVESILMRRANSQYVCMYTSINIVSKCISIWGLEKNVFVDEVSLPPKAKNPHRRKAKSETPIAVSACSPQKPMSFFNFWNQFFECIYVFAHFCWRREILVWAPFMREPIFYQTWGVAKHVCMFHKARENTAISNIHT